MSLRVSPFLAVWDMILGHPADIFSQVADPVFTLSLNRSFWRRKDASTANDGNYLSGVRPNRKICGGAMSLLPSTLSRMEYGTPLHVDPVEATAITKRAAANPVSATPMAIATPGNAFDSAVAALLAWAAAADAGAASSLHTRGTELSNHSAMGFAKLAAMNTENACHLGEIV